MTYKVMGIDPGTSTMGVSIFTIDKHTNRIKDIRGINIEAKKSLSLDDRLEIIYDKLVEVITTHTPTTIYCETPFINAFRPTSIIPLARCFQTIKLAIYESKIPLDFIPLSPIEVKMSVGGNIRTDKDEMHKLVKNFKPIKRFYPRLKEYSEHIDDSIAVVLCGYDNENNCLLHLDKLKIILKDKEERKKEARKKRRANKRKKKEKRG